MLNVIMSIVVILLFVPFESHAQLSFKQMDLFTMEKEISGQDFNFNFFDVDGNYVKDIVFDHRTADNYYLMVARNKGFMKYSEPEVLFDLASIEGVWKDSFDIDNLTVCYTIMDHDGDGDQDIALFSQDAECNYVTIHENEKGQYSEVIKIYESLDRIEQAGQLEAWGPQEGVATFLMLQDHAAGLVYILENTQKDGKWIPMDPVNVGKSKGVTTHDFDFDHDIDLLYTDPVGGNIGAYLNGYNKGFDYMEWPVLWDRIDGMQIFKPGDLNGDSNKDLLLTADIERAGQSEHFAYVARFDREELNFTIRDTIDISTGTSKTDQKIEIHGACLGITNMSDLLIKKDGQLYYASNMFNFFNSPLLISTNGIEDYRFLGAEELSGGGNQELLLLVETDNTIRVLALYSGR